jgi:hypothetical protein
LKKLSVAFCVISLCSLVLLVNALVVNAAQAGYDFMIYPLQNTVTFDGKWTNTAEWTDGAPANPPISANANFRGKWGPYVDSSTVPQYFLVEILNDNTNDANDYWQICIDSDQSGGTAPGSGDLRIDIVGHSNVTFYQGTGTAWGAMATPGSSDFQWKDSISASPTSSTPHWILEIMVNKPALGIGILFNGRIAVYDASNNAAGVQAWPPTSRDVPNNWGTFPYSSDAIPENLTFGVVMLLSSVAVLAGSFAFRKKRVGKLANSSLR